MLCRTLSLLVASDLTQAPPSQGPDVLTIAMRADADCVTLTLHGEVDIASAPALEPQMRNAEELMPRRVVLDLAAVDFIDSTGVHALIRAQQRAERIGYELVVAHPSSIVQRLFSITGITARFRIE